MFTILIYPPCISAERNCIAVCVEVLVRPNQMPDVPIAGCHLMDLKTKLSTFEKLPPVKSVRIEDLHLFGVS